MTIWSHISKYWPWGVALVFVCVVVLWSLQGSGIMKLPMDNKQSSVVTGICSAFPQGYGYVVDEYRNGNGKIGGYISYSLTSLGGSAYYYDHKGVQVDEVLAVMDLRDKLLAAKHVVWAASLKLRYPIKKTYQCDEPVASRPLTYTEAEKLAQQFVATHQPASEFGHTLIVVPESGKAHPFGWEFSVVSEDYAKTHDPNDMIPGIGPLVVNNGRDVQFLTSSVEPKRAIEEYARQYAASSAGESIGTATMDEAGVITLMLRAEGPGMMGDAMFTYAPGDPKYQSTLNHLGDLKPGESKLVPPFE